MRFITIIFICLSFIAISCGKDRQKQAQTENKLDPTTKSDNPEIDSKSKISTDWPMLMSDIEYKGISQDKALRPPLYLIWKFKTGGPINSSPVVFGKTVYIGSDDKRLYALNTDNWELKWDFEAGGKITTAPTVYRGIVYFSSRDLKIYALDARTGKKKWETQVDGWVHSPIVVNGDKLYVGCYENKIYILNALTGKKEGNERARIKIGIADYACVRGEFYPIDAYTRSSVWRNLVRRSESWPASANGFVYIGSRDNKIHAFNASNRKPIWEYETGGWVDSSPAISDGKLFVGSKDGYVYAFSNKGEPFATDFSNQGLVTKDRANIYNQPDTTSKITQINSGTILQIIGKTAGNWYLGPSTSWFNVRLPNKKTGWIEASDFIRTSWIKDLQINLSLVKDVNNIDLPKNAETTSWSNDGSSFAFFANVSGNNIYWMAQSIWIASGDGRNPKWVSDGAFFNPNVTWSNDNEWIIFENLSGNERQIWKASSDAVGLKKVGIGEAPSLSPKGDMVAFLRRGKSSTSVWTKNLETKIEKKIAEIGLKGQESYITYGYNASLTPPAWSPDGTIIAVGFDGYHYDDKFTRIVLINTIGGIIKEFAVRAWKMKNTEFSADGKKIAYVTQEHSTKEANDLLDKQVHIAVISDSGNTKTFEYSQSISWSPSGRYLAFIEEATTMGINRKVWIFDTERNQLIQLLSSKELIEKVVWLKNGKIIVFARENNKSESNAKIRCWVISAVAFPR